MNVNSIKLSLGLLSFDLIREMKKKTSDEMTKRGR